MIEFVVRPAGDGFFEAYLPDPFAHAVICKSRTPFFAAARLLISVGVNPGERLQMRHEGSETVALTGILGKAAKLTVHEPASGKGPPKFADWMPRNFTSEGSNIAPDENSDAEVVHG